MVSLLPDDRFPSLPLTFTARLLNVNRVFQSFGLAVEEGGYLWTTSNQRSCNWHSTGTVKLRR